MTHENILNYSRKNCIGDDSSSQENETLLKQKIVTSLYNGSSDCTS